MLLGLQNVTFEFGARTIVQNINWYIQPGEKIGLVGQNGSGKSTLLKLFTNTYQPNTGDIIKARGLSIGFLHQDLLSFTSDAPILNVVLQSFESVNNLEKNLTRLKKALEAHPEDEQILLDYSDHLAAFEEAGGYEIEHQAKNVLDGLGFQKDEYEKPYGTFSGGWRMRILLAQIILQKPDILLLDEPTNHLDLPSIEWLEKYLTQYAGSIVIVSHDKYFLNKIVNKVVALEQKKLHFYAGNYDFYETEKVLREEIQQKAFENQQDYIKQQETFVERFKAKASKAAQAQSIIKKLEKIERIEEVKGPSSGMNIAFEVGIMPGKIIAELKGITKKFATKTLLENTDADIIRQDKIALLGANGIGKSTLLRMITDQESYDGHIKIGHNVHISFYAQHQLESLNKAYSIFEEVQKNAPVGVTDQNIRNMLGCFLFGGDTIDKKIKILSGGERARVALCKVMLTKANFLILDEPTNHLDLQSIELLIEALKNYKGTLLFVSHDRYFISRVANKIWHISNHYLQEFLGNYTEWEMVQKSKKTTTYPSDTVSANKKKEKPKTHPISSQSAHPSPKHLEKELEKIDRKLHLLKTEQQTLEEILSAPDTLKNIAFYKTQESTYKNLCLQISELEKAYEIIFNQLF